MCCGVMKRVDGFLQLQQNIAVKNLFPGTSSVKSIAELPSSTLALVQF
jgi:hypothetical protein